MKKILATALLTLSFAPLACGGETENGNGTDEDGNGAASVSECERASTKLEECLDAPLDDTGETQACLDGALCVSRCIEAASCTEIEDAFDGDTTPFSDCVLACPSSVPEPEPEPEPSGPTDPICDAAVEFLATCFPGITSEPGATCSGGALCGAQCILASSCEDIEAAFAGEQNSYADCVTNC